MKCIICGKETSDITNVCGSGCMQKTNSALSFKHMRTVEGLSYDLIKKSAEASETIETEVPMIRIKHRWMRQRNVVVGSTVMSFDENGIACLPDLGKAKDDVKAYIQHSGGLVSYYKGEEKEPEPKVLVPRLSDEPAVAERRIESAPIVVKRNPVIGAKPVSKPEQAKSEVKEPSKKRVVPKKPLKKTKEE